MLEAAAKIEADGESVFAKEHAHFLMKPNVLVHFVRQNPGTDQSIGLDDIWLRSELIDSVTPLLLFQHPALSILSNWRKQIPISDWDIEDEDLMVWSSPQWIRMLFDFFSERFRSNNRLGSDQVTIVIEAYDVVQNTVPLVNGVCGRLGLHPAGVKYQWEKVEIVDSFVEHDSQLVNRYLSRLKASTVVERGHGPERIVCRSCASIVICLHDPSCYDPNDIDIDAEERKWKVEFGETVALRLREIVNAEMPNYEYLKN